MIIYTTGDLLSSEATALVNTVNCEGYMGKGIAYQFKLNFPNNNEDYIKACQTGVLTIGKLHYFIEKEKIIINFPTKNKWREKSKIEYIISGLDELIRLIKEKNIESIAIPPLGSGNGGLDWSEVKGIIESKLSSLPNEVNIYIYEPLPNYNSKNSQESKLNFTSLILLKLKLNLDKFDKTRLQQSAYFFNVYSGMKYFNFIKHQSGPYDKNISSMSREIKDFQNNQNVIDSSKTFKIIMNRLISANVEKKLINIGTPLNKTTNFINSIQTNNELDCLARITFLVEKEKILTESEIIKMLQDWYVVNAQKFTDEQIVQCINKLCRERLLEETLVGYTLVKYN